MTTPATTVLARGSRTTDVPGEFDQCPKCGGANTASLFPTGIYCTERGCGHCFWKDEDAEEKHEAWLQAMGFTPKDESTKEG
jgi:hypothetical protein